MLKRVVSSVEILTPLSVAAYLEREKRSDVRHEFIEGYVYAMVGASRRHNLIALAAGRLLHAVLQGAPCRAFVSDLGVQVDARFFYPDVVVSCSGSLDDHIERSPKLIIEVLSPSTEARDRMEKRLAYQSLVSLEEYVLVALDRVHVEVYRRGGSAWTVERYEAGEHVRLASVGTSFLAEQLYEDVLDGPE
ncbi:MAG: Uma2 family endonuclease [Myxococcota bacterium]